MTTVETHDYRIRNLGYGYEVVDAMHGDQTVAGPFTGPDAIKEAQVARGRLIGKAIAEEILADFRKGIGL